VRPAVGANGDWDWIGLYDAGTAEPAGCRVGIDVAMREGDAVRPMGV
jgi:hypothetical protein